MAEYRSIGVTQIQQNSPEEVHTFLFADLAGFTALTEAHGDQVGAELAGRFVESVEQMLPRERVEIVKTIGDEVMVRASSAADAVELGRQIVKGLAVHSSPPVRVGIHSGPAVAIRDDWFGSSVNLASRVARAARPGEVLITEATRAELAPAQSAAMRPRGERYFKGLRQPVAIFSALRVGGPGHELVVDPVCRMAVDPALAAASDTHRGRRYLFCSERCADAFATHPGHFVGQGPRARSARAAFRTHLRVFVIIQLVLAVIWVATVVAGGPAFPWFLLVLAGWGVPLGLHYRAVRRVL